METKKPWQSKTNYVALFLAIAAFFPSASAWVAANPDMFMWGLSAVFSGLRLISKDKISIS